MNGVSFNMSPNRPPSKVITAVDTRTIPLDMSRLMVGDMPEWSEAECTMENSNGEFFHPGSNADEVAKRSEPIVIADQQNSGRPCYQAMTEPTGDTASAPMYVRLVETVGILPYQSVTVEVGHDPVAICPRRGVKVQEWCYHK